MLWTFIGKCSTQFPNYRDREREKDRKFIDPERRRSKKKTHKKNEILKRIGNK
jgi:hypothetical protein